MKNIQLLPGGALDIRPSSTSSRNDFDFLIGKWKVHNRKLKTRLKQSDEWIGFDATMELKQILHGGGNLDFMHTNLNGKPFEGMTLRLFDPVTKLWSIYWTDSSHFKLDPPVLGSFENGIGSFYCRDVYEGKQVLVQFNWDASNPDAPVWSQALSDDNGRQWEWNWFMHFSKF